VLYAKAAREGGLLRLVGVGSGERVGSYQIKSKTKSKK
jgi:hypothetical protein